LSTTLCKPFPFCIHLLFSFKSSGLKSLISRGQVPTIDILYNSFISSLIASYIISQGGDHIHFITL
jgi:hypothetical protein